MINDRPGPADRIAGVAAALLSALPAFLAALLLLAIAAAPVAAQPACVEGESLLDGLDAADRAAIEAEAAEVPNGEGRLFEIAREGVASSYLFGTMHLSDPRVTELPPAAEAALGAAGTLVVETVEATDQAQVAAAVLARPDLTTLPSGTDLIDLVPPEDREATAAALSAAGMPAEAVRTLQPWFVSAALVMPACEMARQSEGVAVLDVSLIEAAEADGIEVKGLETAIEQMEALASLPLDLQTDNLVATVDLLDRLPDIFETMIELYVDGRIAMIGPTIESLAPSGSDEAASAAIYAAFEERVVTRRNHTMAERLAPLLEEGHAFVAVGALHLPGEDGLVELLRAAGWNVTRAD